MRPLPSAHVARHGAGRRSDEFFPDLISGPFHDGLVLVFAVSAAFGVIVSLMRGSGKPPAEPGAEVIPAAEVQS